MERVYPRINFGGDDFARTMGIVFAENLDDLLMKVELSDGNFEKGFLHTSTLPHDGTCYYDEMWSRDSGRGVMELARLGFLEEAEAVIEYFLNHKNYGNHWGRVLNKDMHFDYEADGNTHILCAIYRTWLALGRPTVKGRRYVEKSMDVFHWFSRSMEECPYGYLMPSVSELSGNPDTPYPVYAVFATYGTLICFRGFYDMAKSCGMETEAAYFKNEMEKVSEALLSKLVSPGGAPRVLTPKGVWLNGLDGRDGRKYELAEFGRIAVNAHHWTRQLPYIQGYDIDIDSIEMNEMYDVNKKSYEYIKAEMAKGYYFRKYGFVSNTCWSGIGGRHDDTMCGYGQNYFTQAALMADDVNTYTQCLKGIARLAYDGDVIEPLTFDMNPWIIHECFNYENFEIGYDHTFGAYGDDLRDIYHNPGDEGNLVQATETLKTLALVAGISAKGDNLTIKPRLPWTWDYMEVRDWPVVGSDGIVRRVGIELKHERWLKKTRIKIKNTDGISNINIRFGPYPFILANESRLKEQFRIERSNAASWLWGEGLSGNINMEIQL